MQGKLETRVGLFVLAALGVFIYMGFQIGAFRFDRHRYASYTMFFKDISGLSRKAEVKIAGVKVGWVEDLKLVENHKIEAEAKIMLLREYKLYSDAHAIVRQEGLLGPKYLEIVPGDPMLPILDEGQTLGAPGVSPVSMDELLQKFKNIADNVEDVTGSFKQAIGGEEGADQLKSIFANLNKTTERLEADVLPAIKESVEKMSTSFEEASLQARDSFASIDSIASKIDDGKGLMGKLVNEDETYKDLKVAVSGLRNYFASVDKMQIIFDGHSEVMMRPAEHFFREDAKFFFDVRIHPDEDYFYLVQLASSLKGWNDRFDVRKAYAFNDDRPVDLVNLNLTDNQRVENQFVERRLIQTRNVVKFGLQFGKIFKDIAFRVGLFEGTGGLGMDIDIPFDSDSFRWVTTFEIYDMVGWNRVNDDRPHLKWLNRMFVMKNIYFTFGADDFVSKQNANVFFGFGMRFGDDNAKYLLQTLGGGASAMGGGYVYGIN